MKKIGLKTKLSVLLICFMSFFVKADAGKTPCDSTVVKIFGIVILEKYYGDCDSRNLPDGKWDWWPNW
jgi:hypothetical protein